MQHPAERSEKRRILSDLFSRPEYLPAVLFILFFTILYGAGPELRSSKYVFEPPWLLFALNTVFITGLGLLIAWLCFRSFLRGGFLNILLLGCGVLAFGMSSLAAGWLIRPPHSLNDAITVHNIGVLCTAAFYFLSSLFTAFGFSMEIETRRGMIAAAACSAVLLLSAALTSETVHQVLPPFFVIEEGPTVIRQVVLSVSVTLLITSALLMMTVYAERKTGFLLYSINALLLIGAGIAGVAIGAPGSPFNWLGRASQYLGNVYLAGAAMKALGEARSRGTTVEAALAAFFRTSETHFKALVELAADAIISINHKGKIILMNPAAEETFGYGRHEAAGQSVAELIVPEQSRELFHACLYGEPCRNIGMELQRKDGTILPAELSFSPEMRFGAGMTRTVIIRDVTERMRAEAALQESEERYRRLFESMNEGFALHELLCDESGKPCDYRFLEVNPAFERLTGLKRRDVAGRTVAEVLPGTEPSWIQRFGEVALTGTPDHFESHSSALDRDFEVFAYRPAPGQFAVIFLDVTKRKQAEEALREAKEHLERRVQERTAELKAAALYARSLIEVNLDPLVTINPEGRITDVNRATEQATGVPRDRLIGSDFSDYFTDPEAARAGYRKVFTESQVRDYPLTIRNANGRLTDVLYHASVYRNEAGEVQGVFAAARDITELRKAEAALKEANESLERRVSERTEALQQAKDYTETLLQTANVLIVELDETGNVQRFNDAAEKITGFSRAEILGRNWFEVAVPRDRYPHVWDEFLRLQSPSFPSEFENVIVTRDGRERVISWRNSEIRQGERLRGTISFGRDITDRKRAEAALRQNEARFRLLSGTAGRLLATDDPHGMINELCRDVMEHLDCQAFFNFMVDESQGRLHLNACAGIPEGEVRKLEWLDYGVAVCGCVARDKTRIIAEDIFHTPDARTELVKSYGIHAYCCHPLKTRDRLIGTLSFGTKTRAHFTPEEVELMRTVADQVAIAMQRIGDRKSLQEALDVAEEGRRMLEVIMENVPEGITIADGPGMRIRMVSRHGLELLGGRHDGLSIPEAAGRWKVYHADGETPMADEDLPLARAIRSGDIVRDAEVVQVNARGDRLSLLCNAAPIKDGDGRILGGVVAWRDITARVEAEEALRRSESRYRSYIEVTGQMGWTTNADGEVVEDVPALRQYTGQSFDEMRGWGWSKALHPDDLEITLAVWRKAVEEKQGYDTEYRLRRHDGVYRYFLARGVPVLRDDGSVREWVGTCIDITERRKQEEDLRKLNRTLRALSRSDEALMRAEEESAFLEDVCRIVVHDCGYAMVWIGYASDDEDKTVRPVAHAGFDEGYLEALNLTWADRERGRGPTGTAIRTGKPILCTDMLTDPRFEPWRDEAIRRGYASSLALPLLDEGRAFGAVTIYSMQPDPFSEEEIELLSEMADGLTYGIASLRLRLQSRQTLQALQESEARFRQLADSMPQLVWTAQADGRVDYYNRRLSLFTTHGPWRPYVHAEEYPRTVEAWKSAIRTGSPYEIEHRMQLADGRFRWFLTRAVPVPDDAGHVVKWYGTSTDVHDRKQAEEEREIARIEALTEKNRLEAIMEAIPVGVAMVNETGGNIRSNSMYEQLWGGPRPEARAINDYSKYKAWWIDTGRQVQPEEWASALAVRKGETVTGQLLKIERFDGTGAFVMNSAAPIYASGGRIAGSAVAILDITERIEAEQALQKAKEELEDKVRERTAELILLLEDLEKSRDDLRKLASELVLAEERERKKISVTLHDEVAQTLAAARMRIDLLRSKPGDDDSRRALDEAQQLLVQAIRETRSLMTDISNPVLYDMGLKVAVQSLTEEVKARNGISFSSTFGGSLKTLDQDMEVMIFQLVKELVQNIVKHSRAGTASIRIVEERDDIKVVVADDGLGFDVGNVGAVGLDGGFGLFSIRERVKSYGGKIRIESAPGKGSEVTVMLPKKAGGSAASRKIRKRKEKT